MLNELKNGARVGKWTLIEPALGSKRSGWLCACECGRTKVVCNSHLRSGASSSCGCSRRRPLTHGGTSGKKKTLSYVSWRGMRERCSNPNHIGFHRYGGRGISVCPEWNSYAVFLEDMGDRPGKNYSLERVDTSLGYNPSNCVWATAKQQARNMSRNKYITLNGKTLLLCEWAELVGIPSNRIIGRINRDGWSEYEAVFTPLRSKRRAAKAVLNQSVGDHTCS